MKFYDIDVLAQKYGGGNKYVATSLVAESACRLSERRNPDDNDPEKEKYLSEVLAQFEKGLDVEQILGLGAPSGENAEAAPAAGIIGGVDDPSAVQTEIHVQTVVPAAAAAVAAVDSPFEDLFITKTDERE